MKKEKKTANFHAKITPTHDKMFGVAVEKSPKNLRIKSKTDLFVYMLETFCSAIGVK